MNKKIIALITVAVVLIAAVITVAAYDSSEDPLVSLSYLTDIFKPQILKEVDKKINAAATGNTTVQPSDNEQAQETSDKNSSAGYIIVELTAGDALYAGDACDIMLRAGTAVCIAPDAKQGIADYTDATEILNGEALIKNHMCLIPRGDGRGVLATSESVYIMVRGEYSVVKH